PLLPPVVEVTSTLSYLRFHGFGSRIWFDYDFRDEELEEWVPIVRGISSQPGVKRVNLYFNNHFSGYAVKNALEFLSKLGLQPVSKPKDVDRLEFLKKSGRLDPAQKSLNNFFKK
ncbi:MAG: DUF72 domain-containing protein, partial [Promethearchaeota archaeon]